MLIKQDLGSKNIEDYKKFAGEEELANFESAENTFKNKKIVHINATSQGGGVAEILKTLVPLQESMGLDADWYYLEPDSKLFAITKKLHNSLQGAEDALTDDEKEYYVNFNKKLAGEIEKLNPDILMIHDPQPLPVIDFLSKKIPSVIRIHIDSTQPNEDSKDFITPYLLKYDKIVFSLEDFVPPNLEKEKVTISPPAIDPLSEKNAILEKDICNTILISSGIHPDKPLITQISRFDTWKDPLGVIEAYYKVKNEIPNLQLVLAGVMEASDDPEAAGVLEKATKEAKGDPDIFLISKPEHLGDFSMGTFINALQRSSDVVFQKSLREGFGLTVTEAMWKSKPVIGGNVGGIRLQIEDGVNGFLVDSPAEAADKTLALLRDPDLAREIGKKAEESVKENFLMTRLLNDELKIMESIMHKYETQSAELEASADDRSLKT